MKGYSGTGDKGETGLYGGTRVGKENPRVEAYGAVDELNSQVGLVRALLKKGRVEDWLRGVQRDLFTLGGDLASELVSANVPRVDRGHVAGLEKVLEEVHAGLRPLKRFILPTGTIAAAELHVARSVCRRAERRVVALARVESINPEAIPYLNRLSSLLFDLARLVNKEDGGVEEEWTHD
ncbi:ATP:cob(I)alamin adenosyltransferase [archaeon 13_1_20CM_2_54_9]|nr:MAG: ATP:cob(I)alamin adenosyltransferase [Crenarchaeota archaeon 13_1_40CM_3_53_5]OLE77180.1 MAG: ATP:cob(I)alamin adenosyltransferase [archaeon 13_1_20CM_2_54_9]